MGGDTIMAFNLGEKLKNQGVANPSQLFSEGESADKLLDEFLKEENIESQKSVVYEELLEQNKSKISKEFSIKCDDKFSERVAILEVESSDEENIIIRFRSVFLSEQQEVQLDTQPTEAPKISFNKSMEAKNIKTILGEMIMFADENFQARQLRSQLIKLQQKQELILNSQENQQKNESFYLVINDRTQWEIPWELLKIQSEDNYLGSSFITVRWQDMIDPYDLVDLNNLINLKIQEKDCCGNIVAYLNTKDLPSVEEEKKYIKEKFNPVIHQNIYEFLDFLNSDNSTIGLIFVASHGFLGDNLSGMKLGGEESKEQISLPELHEYRFKFLAQNSCVVFMNTCHSGRLHQDDSLNIMPINPKTGQQYPMGFSTFFLKKGAVGVIGTLCKVIDKYAAKVSSNFFAEYQENPHLSVATILKNLRAKAVEKYQQERNQENKYLLISTFMYVYYGNPLAKLNIRESN